MMLARRFVTFTKLLIVGAGGVTALCMGAVMTLQFGFWFMTNAWIPFPVSRIFELAEIDVPRRYVLASMDASESRRFDLQRMIEWLLDLPAVVALLAALALLALCHASLSSLEKGLPEVRGHEPS